MNFSTTLISWYTINKRSLPWRETKKPYLIWLSEIILQQTQIKQGLPYYVAFVTKFPTIFDLANANEQQVLNLWQGLGYYSRARNLHFTAKYIVNDLKGEFPNTYKNLIKLKGVGDYTASAIASICFNEQTAVVDGNVYRFLSRYFGINTPINSTKGIKEFKAIAQELINKDDPATFNQAIMEFGAKQCKPANPDCIICPFNSSCVALQKKQIKELPVKLKKTKISKKYFNFLVFISKDGKTIFKQRKGKGIWQNLYQFPLIETEKAISVSILQKEEAFIKILDKFDYSISLFNKKGIVHKLSHQHLNTKFWIVTIESLPEAGILIEDLNKYPMPILINNFINDFNF